MKILHCCLAAFYIDGYGYQENILPRAHKAMGFEVEIVASTETYTQGTKRIYTPPATYVSGDGIPVARLGYVKWLPKILARKLRLYNGLQKKLDAFKPDVVFLHDLQFLDIWRVRRYAHLTGARIYVDSHTDGINSAKGIISRFALHGLIYRFCAKLIEPVTTMFYPTLPLRGEFMEKVYGISRSKMRLLPFGVDDVLCNPFIDEGLRGELRQRHGVAESDIVLVAGGKIDKRKNIIDLLRIFDSLRNGLQSELKLVLFGAPDEECAEEYGRLINQSGVITVGWLAPRDVTQLLQIADLAIFPGTHSVLWEEAVGLGIPCVFKRWPGIEHVDIGGNCLLVEDTSSSGLLNVLSRLLADEASLARMSVVARSEKREQFLYSKISAAAIGLLPDYPSSGSSIG